MFSQLWAKGLLSVCKERSSSWCPTLWQLTWMHGGHQSCLTAGKSLGTSMETKGGEVALHLSPDDSCSAMSNGSPGLSSIRVVPLRAVMSVTVHTQGVLSINTRKNCWPFLSGLTSSLQWEPINTRNDGTAGHSWVSSPSPFNGNPCAMGGYNWELRCELLLLQQHFDLGVVETAKMPITEGSVQPSKVSQRCRCLHYPGGCWDAPGG